MGFELVQGRSPLILRRPGDFKNLIEMTDKDNTKEDFVHRYTRRSRHHDYFAPAIYHVIIKKHPSAPVFGILSGDPRFAPDLPGSASIAKTALGKIVQKKVYDFRYAHPDIQSLQFIVMPDHVHMLFRVTQRLPKHIGFYISRMKAAVKKKWTDLKSSGNPEQNAVDEEIFEENYTDRIIYASRSLDAVYKYIRDNPHRLAIRKLHPEFFCRIRKLKIGGEDFHAYGNALLLRNPFKRQVVVHRKDTTEEFQRQKDECIEEIVKGGLLVSPFISPREKEIFEVAIKNNGRFIYVQQNPFGERYKPSGREFDLCCEGRLLIIVPVKGFENITMREIFLKMNKISEEICVGNFRV